MKIEDVQKRKSSKFLFVGRSGTGKSTVAAQFPGKTYVFDLDRRIKALEDFPDVEFDFYSHRNFIDKIDVKIKKFIELANKKQFPYDNILFSSLTSYIKGGLKEAKELYGKNDAMTKGSVQLVEMQHWNYIYTARPEIFEYGLFILHEIADVNIILEAHLVNDYETVGEGMAKERVVCGERVLAPDKMSEEVPTTFDEVWYFKKRKAITDTAVPDYECFFRSEIARTNFKKLPNSIKFTNQNLYKLIEEKLK